MSKTELECYVETPGGNVLHDGTFTPKVPDHMLLALSSAGMEVYAVPCDRPVDALCD